MPARRLSGENPACKSSFGKRPACSEASRITVTAPPRPSSRGGGKYVKSIGFSQHLIFDHFFNLFQFFLVFQDFRFVCLNQFRERKPFQLPHRTITPSVSL
jgi:hypothetical protein